MKFNFFTSYILWNRATMQKHDPLIYSHTCVTIDNSIEFLDQAYVVVLSSIFENLLIFYYFLFFLVYSMDQSSI